MELSLRKYSSFDEMKADEYRYWQSRPVHGRMDAVEELNRAADLMKGTEAEPNVPGVQGPLIRIPCPWRENGRGRSDTPKGVMMKKRSEP
jgi:hypothetical protein